MGFPRGTVGAAQPPGERNNTASASTCASRAHNFALPKVSGGQRAPQGKRRERASPVGQRTPKAGDPHGTGRWAGRAPHGSATPRCSTAEDPSPRAATRKRKKLKTCFRCSQKAKGIGHSPGTGRAGRAPRAGADMGATAAQGSGRSSHGWGERGQVLTIKTPLDTRISRPNNRGSQPRVPRARQTDEEWVCARGMG